MSAKLIKSSSAPTTASDEAPVNSTNGSDLLAAKAANDAAKAAASAPKVTAATLSSDVLTGLSFDVLDDFPTAVKSTMGKDRDLRYDALVQPAIIDGKVRQFPATLPRSEVEAIVDGMRRAVLVLTNKTKTVVTKRDASGRTFWRVDVVAKRPGRTAANAAKANGTPAVTPAANDA